MEYKCPECGIRLVLQVQSVIVLPADDRDDEVSLQLVECDHCDYQAVAVYRENRRGSDEAWSFDGWAVPEGLRAELEAAISSCPRPQDPRCGCAGHQKAVETSKKISAGPYETFRMDPD